GPCSVSSVALRVACSSRRLASRGAAWSWRLLGGALDLVRGLERKRLAAGRLGLAVLRLGLDHRTHPSVRITRRGDGLAAADHLEKLGCSVIGDVVALD